MPQEFLRDVLRTGDAAGRRQRRWSILPLSIAGHAVVLTVFLLSPWLSEVDLPVIASPLTDYIKAAPSPPPPPSPPTPVSVVDISKAPIVAPTDFLPEQPKSSAQRRCGRGDCERSGRPQRNTAARSVRHVRGRCAARAATGAPCAEAGARWRRYSRTAKGFARRPDLS